MIFQSFWVFYLGLPLIILVFLYLAVERRRKIASLQFSLVSFVKQIPHTFRVYLLWLPLLLKGLALIFLLLALARPQSSNTLVKRNVEGIDIMIALDISDSMLIEDMKPMNRLEAAKDTLKRFVKGRISDRIGIVIFAGESFILVPLTLDYELLFSRVDEITTAQQANIKDGTALGVALANAAGHLKESLAKSRVMIFLTDGENNSGTIDPLTGLELAKGYGIRIYSVGVGRDGPTRIPVVQKDLFGNKTKTYLPFESTVNEDLLSKMAKDTGGKFYRATKEDSLQGIFKDIDALEKSKVDVNKYTRYEEHFQEYLIWAIAFYLLAWILSLTWLRRAP